MWGMRVWEYVYVADAGPLIKVSGLGRCRTTLLLLAQIQLSRRRLRYQSLSALGVVHILRHQVLGHFLPPPPSSSNVIRLWTPPPIWRHQRPPPPIWPLYVLLAAVPVDQNLHRRHQAIRLFLHWGDHDLSLTSGSYSHRPFLPLWLWCCCNMRTFTMTIPCVIQSALDWGMVYATHWTAALTKLWLDGPEADPGRGGG